MDRYKRLRWAVLLSVLTATVGAIVYPVDDSTTSLPAHPLQPISPIRTPLAPASVAETYDPKRPVWVASDDDPFAPRVWQAAIAPAVEPARVVQSVNLAQPAPTPPPTPLPYHFLGQMQDGATHVLYLGHGDQVVLAHEGDVLDGSYKVVAVKDSMIEFESVESGLKQMLPIPAQ